MSHTSIAESVLAALATGPADAAEIAKRASIGRSTASKALAALAGQGAVERTPGGRNGGRRLPDRWSLPAAPAEFEAEPGTTEGVAEARATNRLGRGELRGLVLTYLRDHPGEHAPTAVAKALEGRSSGAVANAMAKLADAGEAVQTNPAPRRYRATGS